MITIDTAEFPMDHQQFCNWYNRHGRFNDAREAIESDHAEALRIEARLNAPSQGHGITFPAWVKSTPCTRRTFSTVIPRTGRYGDTHHGAIRIVRSYPNKPVVITPRIGLPGFYTKWEDAK